MAENNTHAAFLNSCEDNKKKAENYIRFRSALSPETPKARFPGFRQGLRLFRAGEQVQKGARPLPTDILMYESMPMVLSDGTKLYYDIFFPGGYENLEVIDKSKKIPALVAWSPYGKQMGTTLLDDFPFRAGVPKHWLSGLQKWEGPDPAFWCAEGYAVVNIDTRGAYTSEGDLVIMGHQEAQDGAEVVTWLSRQAWCNGKVGLTGNSWLAMSQGKIGSLRPEGLAALAPWEGVEDIIPLRPYGMYWKKNHIMQLSIAGNPIIPFPIPGVKPLQGKNTGTHIIHCLGKGDSSSCLIIPCI